LEELLSKEITQQNVKKKKRLTNCLNILTAYRKICWSLCKNVET